MLIGQQLVQATGEDYLYEQTEISVQCKDMNLLQRKAACADGI